MDRGSGGNAGDAPAPRADGATTSDSAPLTDGSARPDAGDARDLGAADYPPLPAGPPPAGWVRTIMAVGYGGIRVISRDGGLTWAKVAELGANGVDDSNLLRAVAYGNGTWAVAGWKHFNSRDGLSWTPQPAPRGCNLMQGLAFGNGVFVGTCGISAWTSYDGITWTGPYPVGDTMGHTYVFFFEGKFYSSGDSSNSYVSSDGKSWQPVAFRKVATCGALKDGSACPGNFWDGGYHYDVAWVGRRIQRSTDGASWKTVYSDNNLNAPYWFTVGYSPP